MLEDFSKATVLPTTTKDVLPLNTSSPMLVPSVLRKTTLPNSVPTGHMPVNPLLNSLWLGVDLFSPSACAEAASRMRDACPKQLTPNLDAWTQELSLSENPNKELILSIISNGICFPFKNGLIPSSSCLPRTVYHLLITSGASDTLHMACLPLCFSPLTWWPFFFSAFHPLPSLAR